MRTRRSLTLALTALIQLPFVFATMAANTALQFDGVNDYVTFGAAPALNAATFTIETWFKRTGTGLSVSTGSGGVDALPLVSKGRGEADGSNLDMNYFLGVRASDGVLVADFEEHSTGASPGLNHPVAGTTPVSSGVWHHAAATYDGSTWRLYLDGALNGQLAVNRPPRSDSIQHAGLATALNSAGAPAGFFAGMLDEVRIWNYARSGAEIAQSKNIEIASAAGLIGRWGLNEGAGTVAQSSAGTAVSGTLVNGPLWTGGFDPIPPPTTVTRGPYLQMGTPTGVVIRWRTSAATDSRVRYGSAPGNLTLTADNPTVTTEHEVQISGLQPDTIFYYSVGTSSAELAGNDATHFFITSPRSGSPAPTRIWVLGDPGTRTASQFAVRDAYYQMNGSRITDLWLMLGDNAYPNGTDAEYQGAVFDMYPTVLRNSVLWPALGNHDTAQSSAYVDTYPYFQMFTLPRNGEAGGVASGTEHFYSFDFGNIHFICLDSMTASRAANGAMATWLQADLASTAHDWIIAFWHHPPYSKGSHDSDTDPILTEMRQTFLPLLEAGGVDLVLGGHSHSYERSFLIDGHYGTSGTFTSSMIVDGGSGRDTTPYVKPPGSASNGGAVYAVAGASGQISGGPLNHPAMYISMNVLGSVIVDVLTNQMNVTYLDSSAAVRDYFTIVKPGTVSTAPAAPTALTAKALSGGRITAQWADNSSNENGFELERSIDGATFAVLQTLGPNTTAYADSGLTTGQRYYYRVRAFNEDGSSAYSNIASARARR